MANAATVGRKLVLKYNKGVFSFNKIIPSANVTQLYGLAGILNSFQYEKPPAKVSVVTTKQIIA